MFNPNFKYTDKIVKLLTKISASREIILNSPLIPNWEVTLRREAIIRSAHSSTRIEGNRLSLTERQMQIVEFINTAGKITSGDIQRMFKISIFKYTKLITN
jgi:predicted HTH transcriptional regulator